MHNRKIKRRRAGFWRALPISASHRCVSRSRSQTRPFRIHNQQEMVLSLMRSLVRAFLSLCSFMCTCTSAVSVQRSVAAAAGGEASPRPLDRRVDEHRHDDHRRHGAPPAECECGSRLADRGDGATHECDGSGRRAGGSASNPCPTDRRQHRQHHHSHHSHDTRGSLARASHHLLVVGDAHEYGV